MSPVQPYTTDWREWSRFMQGQTQSLGNIQGSLNIGPMRELIPQLGPIRRTDGITGYQAIGTNTAIYTPFVIDADFWDINAFYTVCDTFGNGQVQMGVYSEAGVRLVASTLGTSTNQVTHTISPVVRLTRDRYYQAFWLASVTDTVAAYAGTPFGNDVVRVKMAGIKSQVIAGGLPATATLSDPVVAYIPAIYVGIAAPTT